MSTNDGLYPAIRPYRTGRLRVSPVHELYFEESGNPKGKPALVLHGGPGGGISGFLRQGHDPARYRIILFDQRGSGQSTPYASVTNNTTWDLVSDIEALRAHLGIERWQARTATPANWFIDGLRASAASENRLEKSAATEAPAGLAASSRIGASVAAPEATGASEITKSS